MTILDEIIRYKKEVEIPQQKGKFNPASIQAQAAFALPTLDFVGALRRPGEVALIAEVKKASPSKGLIRPQFDAVELGTTYRDHGAAAISVLTDAKYFQGEPEFLTDIKIALRRRPLPLLRKDFIIDSFQVNHARALGADALLLIAAALSDNLLAELLQRTHRLGMTALVEVHTRAELERVLPLKPQVIGVNNRNLHDFSVDLQTCINLRQYVPADIVFVAESGIHTRADVQRLAAEGIDAILVGEAIAKQEDAGAKVRELSKVMDDHC